MSAEPETPLFGAVERRLFKATAVLFAIVALIALIAGMIWILGIVLSFFYKLILPLSIAGILALVLYPVVDYLERRAWLNRFAATTIVVLLFIAVIAGFIVMVVPALIREIVLFAEMVPAILARWQDFMVTNFPGFTRIVMERAQDGEIKEAMPNLASTGDSLKTFAGVLAGLSFVPLMLFFALLSGGRLHVHITEGLSVFNTRAQKKIMYFIDVFLAQVTGFFQGQLVIAVIMGVLFAIGFSLIGLKGGILIGLILGLLNIVPFLGTLIGLLIALPLAYMQPSGGFQLLGLTLIVFTIVQLVESWLLTPKIMANRSGLHPALVVISVFFWGTAFGGITGMILAVPLTAFLVAAWIQAKPGLTLSLKSQHEAGRIESASGIAPESTTKDSEVTSTERVES
jgi:predicted PurR-regulated permease PerM